MKKIIKKVTPIFIWKQLSFIYSVINNRIFLKKNFKKIHGYELNLKKPTTYNEKIQFRKKYGNYKFMSLIADKYKVREYVKEKIGEKYLIPLLGVYDKITVEDLKRLPNQFIIKVNHGSGLNYIEIVRDKDKINLEKLVEKMNKATKERYGYKKGEDFYDLIEPKIMVEKLLLDKDKIPEDYKFQCFNNRENFFVQVDKGRMNKHCRNIYDSDYKFLNVKYNLKYPHFKIEKKPKKFKEMKEIAKILSEDFDYIRVDLYNLDGKIYFGELTQTSANGFGDFEPQNLDKIWGEYWDLEFQNEKLYRIKNPLMKGVKDIS